jgi:hypothetical protein
MGKTRAWTGTVERAALARFVDGLNGAGFPVVPPHRIPPGTVRTIVVRSAGQEHSTYPTAWHEAKKMAGYGEVYKLLDSIIAELTSNAIPAEGGGETGLVRDAAAEG